MLGLDGPFPSLTGLEETICANVTVGWAAEAVELEDGAVVLIAELCDPEVVMQEAVEVAPSCGGFWFWFWLEEASMLKARRRSVCWWLDGRQEQGNSR